MVSVIQFWNHCETVMAAVNVKVDYEIHMN